MQMLKYLAVTVLGPAQHDIVNELAKLTASSGCNIITSHISRLGNEYVANLLLSGTWSSIAKIEASFPALEQKQNINVVIRRTEILLPANDVLPYSVYLVAIDRPGIIYKITHFFAEQQININELTTDSYTARQSSTVMLTISMRINIPLDMHIADLRERFILFCDDLNIDAILEPERN